MIMPTVSAVFGSRLMRTRVLSGTPGVRPIRQSSRRPDNPYGSGSSSAVGSPTGERFGDFRTQHTRPEDADGEIFTLIIRERFPVGLLFKRLIIVEAAEPVQHGLRRIPASAPHTGIFQTKQGNIFREHFRVSLQLTENGIHPAPRANTAFKRRP